MAKIIYKYDISFSAREVIQMPLDAEVLCVQPQFGMPKLWALVDTQRPIVDRVFCCCPTGAEIYLDKRMRYINTIQLDGGAFVFHYFEIVE